MKHFRIRLVLAFIVLVCGIMLIRLVYVVLNQPTAPSKPGIVVSTSSPVAAPVQPISNLHPLTSTSSHHVSYSQPNMTHSWMKAGNAAPSRGLYTTSSAQVHFVGGGSGGFTMPTVAQQGTSQGIGNRGIAVMPMTNFVAMASVRPMSEPEAQEAPQMASMASSPRRAPGPPNPPGPLPEDNQLVEHPIGDALLPLLCLALAYVIYIRTRRRKEI